MQPITTITGRAIPLDVPDVDTDVIIPGQYLKRPERTGFGQFAFAQWRKDPDFVLNDPRYANAPILLAGANFGCGSSREHAPWALQELGLKAIIAPSFGDIFRNNAGKVGLLAVIVDKADVDYLMKESASEAAPEIRVDLASQTVSIIGGDFERTFDIDPFLKSCLLEGLDDIALTLQQLDAIERFEARRSDLLPKAVA
jgi:3-isopropylmalate/(R)-2-methylmalate dehydratase small subunit